MKSKIISAIMIILGICLFIAVVYGGIWIAKHISWSLFYEDLVRETIIEMVKDGSLK